MAFKHQFKADLSWSKEIVQADRKTYERSHQVSIQGKSTLEISAAKAFKGDPSKYNPEDLLLSSLISCHMMSFLYVCTQNNIDILSYTDHAEAILESYPDGSGRFMSATLNPKITITDPEKVELANLLHQQAHQLCFIANSCNFPIQIIPECSVI